MKLLGPGPIETTMDQEFCGTKTVIQANSYGRYPRISHNYGKTDDGCWERPVPFQ